MEHRAAARRERGAQIELVTAAKARSIEPGLSTEVMAASYCPMDGFAKANQTGFALYQALKTARVDIRGSYWVERVEPEDRGYAVIGQGEVVRARRLVLAGGVWLEEMLNWLAVRVPMVIVDLVDIVYQRI